MDSSMYNLPSKLEDSGNIDYDVLLGQINEVLDQNAKDEEEFQKKVATDTLEEDVREVEALEEKDDFLDKFLAGHKRQKYKDRAYHEYFKDLADEKYDPLQHSQAYEDAMPGYRKWKKEVYDPAHQPPPPDPKEVTKQNIRNTYYAFQERRAQEREAAEEAAQIAADKAAGIDEDYDEDEEYNDFFRAVQNSGFLKKHIKEIPELDPETGLPIDDSAWVEGVVPEKESIADKQARDKPVDKEALQLKLTRLLTDDELETVLESIAPRLKGSDKRIKTLWHKICDYRMKNHVRKVSDARMKDVYFPKHIINAVRQTI